MARRLGKPLHPHQQHMVDIALEIDPDTGMLAYSDVVLIGPRQLTGKTETLLPVMTHRCTAFDRDLVEWIRAELGLVVPAPGPQRVLFAAQTGDESRRKWRDVQLPRLEASRYRRDFAVRLQRNSESFLWRNGSTWSPTSTTGKTSGTGDTVDMPVLDEVWAQDARTELGMRPAMLTRPWRQMWKASMIPGLSRAQPDSWPYLKHMRQVGRARVEADVRYGTAFFDFAAPDGMDPADPATWRVAMPGLGHFPGAEKAVREDFEAMDFVDFCAEYLGWEPLGSTPRWTLIRQETWQGLLDRESHIAGRPALAVEMSDDRTQAVIGVAGRRGDGHWHGAVAEPGHQVAPGVAGVGWALPRTLELVKELKPWTVVIDPSRPAASLIVPLRRAGVDVTTPTQRDVAGACGRFFDATGEEEREGDDGVRVFHIGQPPLDRDLAGARKLDVGNGSFVLVKKGGGAPVIRLYSVILAMHGHDVKSKPVPRSKVW